MEAVSLLQGMSFGCYCAHMAQVVEHSLGKGEVTGSNPVVGTIYLSAVRVLFF